MSSNIFITGVTGQIGSFVAKELLNKKHRLFLLVRGENPEKRIEQIFEKLDIKDKNYCIINGDILDKEMPELDETIDHFFHCAADLSFDEKHANFVNEANVTGTKNMLQWCYSWNCPSFHYVSTAYVAGKYNGIFDETMLDEGQEFNNEYEHSKMLAEKICQKFTNEHNIILKIYRPGIVMGEYTGKTLKYTGFYVLLKLLDKIAELHKKKPRDKIRIQANPSVIKHLVGIDYVSKSIATTISNFDSVNETIFLLAKNTMTAKEIIDILQKIFNLPELQITVEELTEKNSLERMINKGIEVYRPYLNEEPVFNIEYSHKKLEKQNLIATSVDAEYFTNMIAYGQKDKWGSNKAKFYSNESHAFFTFLANFINKPLLPNVHNINSCFAVEIKHNKHVKYLEIKDGILLSISKKTANIDLDFTYQISKHVFDKMISGNLDPRAAFFSGKTEIIGNIENGLKIANLLRIFFKENPFQNEKN